MVNAPFILTALLDNESQQFFNEKRSLYFPPGRNYLAAHLTLFHHLPANEPLIEETIKLACSSQKILSMPVVMPVSIGKGVAYKLESEALIKLHKRLQKQWLHLLTPQDKQGLWPHITVQNKVTATEAGVTLQALQAQFKPFTAMATGLALWHYLNGPWQLYRQFSFGG